MTVIDELCGFDVSVVNEFVGGGEQEKAKGLRAMTVELSYLAFRPPAEPAFSKLLQTTLHRETRLRAWHSGSKSYETIVQRR